MKIGLISDTHGYFDPSIYKYFENVDEIWHAGDIGDLEIINKLRAFKPTRFVYGNIDGLEVRNETPEYQIFECAGCKILIIHIGGKPTKYTAQAKSLIITYKPHIFICGHSHILRVATDQQFHNMLYLNPGAAGIAGFHYMRTLLRFEINAAKVAAMQAIELGPRTQKKQD